MAEFFDDPATPALLAEYAAECALAGLPEPVPHRAIYDALEQAGAVTLIAIRSDGALIGFLVLLVSMNPHYSQVLGAVESYFVAAARRKTGAGLALLREAERVAKDRGAVALLISAPARGQLADVLHASRNYDHTNAVFCKVL